MERIGVHFLSGPAPTATVEYVKLAEELGYESAWVAEGSGGDPFSILTACALATKTIRLGTGVTPIFSRSAPTIGMAAACVDYFSGGRFILGMGSGHKVQVEQEHGLPFSQPVQRLREAIDVVRMLFRDNEIHYQGSTLSIDGFKLWFEPLRKEIPIYVGAVNPKMIEIGGEIAQGVTMTYCTLERARMAAEHLAIGARRAGKSPEEVVLQTHLPCAVSSNSSKEDAINTIRGVFGPSLQRPRYRRIWAEAGFAEEVEAARQAWVEGDRHRAQQLLPAALIEKFAVVGSPEECRARVQEYRDAGIQLPIISPRPGGYDLVPSAQDFRKQVMEVMHACAPR